jgi:hypothetical protein
MVGQKEVVMVVGSDYKQQVDEKVLKRAFWRVDWMASEKE